MNRTNFRIKLDLCKYHKDMHRFCWIFIDSTKMINIKDVKTHINVLFRINEPFDLFLNEVEYLPPNEDVRILKENETVLVLPKTRLSNIQLSSTQLINQLHLAVSNPVSPIDTGKQDPESSPADSKRIGPTAINSPAAKSSPMQQEFPTDITDKLQNSKESTDAEIPYACARRKRARRRKSSKPEQLLLNEGDRSKNPVTCPEKIRGVHTTVSPVHELTNLLSMVNNSTPPTFENNRVKNTVNAKHQSNEVNGVNANVSASIASIMALGESKEFVNTDLETYPVMTTKPKINDIIAFKMLKIGSDFTPQVSNFIVAEVVSCSPEKSLYIFKVLQGLSEVQVPIGKLNCMDESEEHVMNNTIKLNYAQIMKPRLVSVSSTKHSFSLTS
ncbi:uncharacterized protein LOC117154155 isoform X2 [Bombus vancouverensis nearcticus]|uniref:uncharacterized protein LOC117154155 isoform X2 n=1 Tax=Bombus vancouverensis nearcticus TaxID=2705178 RepID=UPI00143C181C|nr:uncharacterized protein LOC117154155 isoform X2 [Bombus vancouverensis nearcticus]